MVSHVDSVSDHSLINFQPPTTRILIFMSMALATPQRCRTVFSNQHRFLSFVFGQSQLSFEFPNVSNWCFNLCLIVSKPLNTQMIFGDLRLETDQRIGGKSSPTWRTQVKTSRISFGYITGEPMLAWERNPAPLRYHQSRKHGNQYLGR